MTLNLIGKKFNHLTIISFHHKENLGLFYNVVCDCGKEKVIVGSRVSRGQTKSCGCRFSNRFPYGEASFNSLYNDYRDHAKIRGLSFNLDKEYFRALTKKTCVYCGVPPAQEFTKQYSKRTSSTPYVYNGIDRINNHIGYEYNNVVPCCGTCNRAKHALSMEQFMEWITRLVSFQNRESGAICAGGN